MAVTRGAFNQGGWPIIDCINQATIPLGVDFDALIVAMQAYVTKYVAPVWDTHATLRKATTMKQGHWAIVFYDDADVEGALAYHDLTPDGFPLSKVFVKTTLENGDLVSVSASHELVEMLVDPGIQMMAVGPDGSTMYCYESADPCEALSFEVKGIPMSDFVYPSYFEGFRKANSARFDYMRAITKPFQVLTGGYQIVFKDGQWSNVFGSKAKAKQFAKEDRRGHRSETRCTHCTK